VTVALIEPILDELSREAATTRRVLARLPADKLAWKPHEKSKTLGDLAWHVAMIPPRIAAMAEVDDADALAFKSPARPDSVEAMLEAFDEGVRDARERLARLSDEQLGRKLRFRAGERTLAHLPRLAFLRTVMLNHGYHHRGQLSVYLRLLDVPVPPIYGPTADEA
jgi:uncharacterized damage-inducible protein DinB